MLSIMDAITSRPLPGRPLAVPNLLTYARIVAVPVVVACMFGQAQEYVLGVDSQRQPNSPQGTVTQYAFSSSKIFPGTVRNYWVYVPAQYDPAGPASLIVFQDGQAFKREDGDLRAQNVMDNLIYRREIPVMIGVFIDPGRTPEQPEPNAKEWATTPPTGLPNTIRPMISTQG